MNLLSRRLAPPVEPARPQAPVEQSTWMGTAVIWIIVGLLAVMFFLAGAVVNAFDTRSNTLDNYRVYFGSFYLTQREVNITILLGLAAIIFTAWVSALVRRFKWREERHAAYRAAQTRYATINYTAYLTAYQVIHRQWKAALARWTDELYYCHRDDMVFLGGSQAVQPEEMNGLLY
jgi:hypothetical protein